MLKWKVGEVEVYQIVEIDDGVGEIIQNIIKNAIPERIREIDWLFPYFADKAGKLFGQVQSFLIKSGNSNILVDACNGNNKIRTDMPAWGGLNTNFLEKLNDTGVGAFDVDLVVCTHIHCDHVGWNTKLEGNEWVPTFPNARYIFAKEEYDYWKQKPTKEIADDKASFDDSVVPLMTRGLADLVDVDYQIKPNVKLIPSPGHTPGHVCVSIESRGETAIISGDLLHHPCQIAMPQWFTDADTIPAKAVASRERILTAIADTDTLLIGSHFANPVAGKVTRSDGGYMLNV